MAVQLRTGQIADLAEYVRDTAAAALVEGDGIQITVNDGGDTITIASTGPTEVTYREVLMSSDGTATPLTNGAEDDWLYGKVPE